MFPDNAAGQQYHHLGLRVCALCRDEVEGAGCYKKDSAIKWLRSHTSFPSHLSSLGARDRTRWRRQYWVHGWQTQLLYFRAFSERHGHFSTYVARFALGHIASEGSSLYFGSSVLKSDSSGSGWRQACAFSKSESCRAEHRFFFAQIKLLLSEFQWACSFL